MALTFRKSVHVGPFRVNLSTSGIGVSVGLGGLRVGAGPRGAYVSASVAGLQYRRALGGSKNSALEAAVLGPGEPGATLDPAESVDGLAADLNRSAASIPWPAAVLATVALVTHSAGAFGHLPTVAAGWIATPAFVAAVVAFVVHRWRNVVVLLVAEGSAAFRALDDITTGMEQVGSCSRIWWLPNDDLRSRSPVRPRFGRPGNLQANVDFPCVTLGERHLWFLADRLLVEDDNERRYTAVPYPDLLVAIKAIKLVEHGTMPADTTPADTTYEHVCVDGTQDRRFKHNRLLPICEYELLTLSAGTSVIAQFVLSTRGRASRLKAAIAHAAELASIDLQP